MLPQKESVYLIMDSVIARLHLLSVDNLATTLPLAASVETVAQALNTLTCNDIGPPFPPSPPHPAAQSNLPTPDGDLKRLWLLDEKLDSHMKAIILRLDALSSSDPSSQHQVEVDLIEEKRSLQTTIREFHGLQHHCDPDIQVLAEAMRERMAQFSSAIDMYIEILEGRSPLQLSSHIVNTGEMILSPPLRQKFMVSFRSIFSPQFEGQTHPITCGHHKRHCSESLWARNSCLVQCQFTFLQSLLGRNDVRRRTYTICS